MNAESLRPGDALVLVDVQVDFVTGSLAVPGAAAVIAPLNRCIGAFASRRLPVVATRDWHPPDHRSFREQGGPWPAHCVARTPGAAFAPGLRLPEDAVVVSKATRADQEAYSGFEGTDLDARLKRLGVRRLFVGGLATDYCVLRTVRDALALGYATFVLADAIRAVDAHPGDGGRAEEDMRVHGAAFVRLGEVVPDGDAAGEEEPRALLTP